MSAHAFRTYAASVAVSLVTAAWASTAVADTYNYVNWTAADPNSGTASGIIPLAGDGDGGVAVTFTATSPDGGPGTLYGAQTGEDPSAQNYWTPASTYESAQVENAPPSSDLIQLSGGDDDTYTVTLSEPIVDPIMAIVSLGAGGAPTTYNFDSPFTIVSQGTDPWGGSDTALVQLPDNILQGSEGSGVIQFIGTYSTFSWTVPTPESWHGFTFGILTSAALYDGGGPDGSSIIIAADGAASEPVIDAGEADASGDAGAAADAGASVDAAVADASAVVEDAAVQDANATADATAMVDATVAAPDASAPADAGVTSSAPDAGLTVVATASSDCGCSTVGAGNGWGGGIAAIGALAGLVAIARRRRSRTA